ncbi:MAG TPA: SDR family NAD(P)-dependent oxidoreductase, partial [Dyadobacter sp.]|nr:SDR family NAD(P)-dependent oxidoreductase [Dyadobacter sp.]
MMESASKIALVTGGSRGLGKNMALRLAEKGNDVIVVYRSKAQEAAEVVAAIEDLGQKAAAIQLDTADVKSF